MEIQLKYGRGFKTLHLSDQAEVVILAPSVLPTLADLTPVLEQALRAPLGMDPLAKRQKPRTAAIAIPDESRPAVFRHVLPILLKHLFATFPNLKTDDVSIMIGGGLHPPMTEEQTRRWAPPEVTLGCSVRCHDPQHSSFVDYGHTKLGTPVLINADYARADLKIVIGQIDPHQFVGFTGGAKGVIVGCASARTIEHSHGLMFLPGAEVGRLAGNPVREDMNEAGRLAGVDLAINLVLDAEKRPVGLWAGEPEAVLRQGARTCTQVYGVAIEEKFDMAIASCGGYPKDICLYQAQKGLNLASHAVKPGGKMLLLASCDQGVGDDVYYEYVCRFGTCQEAMEDFQKNKFKMGAHKAYLFGKTLTRYEVVIDSELPLEDLRRCHLVQGPAQETLDQWLRSFPGRPRVAVVPNANTTFFHVTEK